jgi:hypothetical protein
MRITRRELFELSGAAAAVRAATVHARADQSLTSMVNRATDVIRDYDGEGFHRTATSVDRGSADRLLARARNAVVGPRLEPFELSRVDPGDAFLEIDRRRIEGLPMFDGTFTGPDGVRGAFGALESGRPIAWIRIGPNAEAELRKARGRAGLRALVVVTTGQRPGLCPVNAAFFDDPFGPPVLQLSSEHLPAIEQAIESGADIRVVAAATRQPATAFNIAADIRGKRPDLPSVCVMTPRSGWFVNASERGGGLVCWLETLRACAVARTLRSVRFVASSGHELGHLGLHAYLKRYPTLAREAVAWVHFGANIGAATGDTRMTCSTSALESMAGRALAANGLEDLTRAPASQVGGEAATIGAEGGRFVSFIGSNEWFHNPGDRWPVAVDIQKVARFARASADLTIMLANSSGPF